jgi:hypothetical protein
MANYSNPAPTREMLEFHARRFCKWVVKENFGREINTFTLARKLKHYCTKFAVPEGKLMNHIQAYYIEPSAADTYMVKREMLR